MTRLRALLAALWCLLLPLISSSFAFHALPPRIQRQHVSVTTTTTQLQAKTQAAKARMNSRWYPGLEDEDVEAECLTVLSLLIRNKLKDVMYGNGTFAEQSHAHDLAQGRFRDLAMTVEGFEVLESLFLNADAVPLDNDAVIYGCIYALQSLCITGMLVGVKGSPEQMQRRVQHLKRYEWREMPLRIDEAAYDQTSMMQRLKFESDQTAGIQLLAQLGMKRTTQGAMDLLVTLGVWTLHEDLNLLRSGFPVTFPPGELQVAEDAAESIRDVDAMLGIRKDLTHHKVYTIDSVSTSEVDDGLSVEELSDGRHKFWIHIADADRWAPRDSEAFQIALGRTTTHYLPTGAIPMFPPRYDRLCICGFRCARLVNDYRCVLTFFFLS
jgi:hypothetical protein